MAEKTCTSAQGRKVLLEKDEEPPEHLRQSSTVGEDDDQDLSNPFGSYRTSLPPANAMGVSAAQNENPIPGPSSQRLFQSHSEHPYSQEAAPANFDGYYSPWHILYQEMETIVDPHSSSYAGHPCHRTAGSEDSHRPIEPTSQENSYEAANNQTPPTPTPGYNNSAHLLSTSSSSTNPAFPIHHAQAYLTPTSMSRPDISDQEGGSGDDQPGGVDLALVQADDMDIDEGSEGVSQGPLELSQGDAQSSAFRTTHPSSSVSVPYTAFHNSSSCFPQADLENNVATSQPDDDISVHIGSTMDSSTPGNNQAHGGPSQNNHTTQDEAEIMPEEIAINAFPGMNSMPAPHPENELETFDFDSFLQNTDGPMVEPASQSHYQYPASTEIENHSSHADVMDVSLPHSNSPLLPWSSQADAPLPALAPPASLLTNEAEVGDLYDVDEDFERNFDVCDFFEYWRFRYEMMKTPKCPLISDQAMHLRAAPRPTEISINDLDEEHCDYQGIDWSELGAIREEARALRKQSYINYTNIHNRYPSAIAKTLPNSDSYFRFNRMNTKHRAHLSHFQLRNIMSATSKNAVYYASRSKIICADPTLGTEQTVMDFTKLSWGSDSPTLQKIPTMTAADGVLIAGGFGGEYAMMSLSASYESTHTSGLVTDNSNGITNHIHTFKDRRSGLPQAVFSSNDDHIRVLDCYTNTFVKEHKYPFPVNCATTSPDGRLRLLVGDHCHPWVVDAESGERIVHLRNHRDYGFACAWADDGIHMATGNQDGIVQVWDARKFNHPLQIISTTMGGVRSLRFSPVGGGKRVLLMAEPADIVSVVDAESFESAQGFDFFGEIGGISFVPDGGSFFVANTDVNFGGLLEFERVGYGERYGMRRQEAEDPEEDWRREELDHEWRPDAELDDDPRVRHTGAYRRRRGLGLHNLVL